MLAREATVQEFLTSPSVLASDKAALLTDVLAQKTDVSESQQNFLKLLAENDRLQALFDIVAQFEALKLEAEGMIDVKVISARKLTAAQSKSMAAKLKARFNKEVNITTEIDKSLIAGAIIYADDVVIDGSARGKLDKLSTTLVR